MIYGEVAPGPKIPVAPCDIAGFEREARGQPPGFKTRILLGALFCPAPADSRGFADATGMSAFPVQTRCWAPSGLRTSRHRPDFRHANEETEAFPGGGGRLPE